MFWSTAVLVIVLLVSNKIYNWIYILIRTLPRDIHYFLLYRQINLWLSKCAKENTTLPKIFSSIVKRHPKKVAFRFEDESWSFEQVEQFSNNIAHYFKAEGYQKGDIFALLLENRAEYPAIWLGLSKIGIVTSLINTNLLGEPLLHCIAVNNCKALIFGTSHTGAVNDISPKIKSVKFYQIQKSTDVVGESTINSIDLKQSLNNVSSEYSFSEELSCKDPVIYIYTSGTTGLPKAAILSHIRLLAAIKTYSKIASITADDVIYTPLPLYHSAGGVVGIGQTFVTGATAVMRKKFSATSYFKDCQKYKATVAQYVGEMCRYILATPKSDYDQNNLRIFLGNGLKPQIWKQFIERFNIKQIAEFYGATEGIANIWNRDGTVGAVGFTPKFLNWKRDITNIRCSKTSGEPIRNKQGYCINCSPDEAGLLIAKIDTNRATFNFEGYNNKYESEKKILHNVFRKGDMYFNSGDILLRDELGYFYFKDRTGDTYRWKAENVSTFEVEAVISNLLNLEDVVVYGVEVPHCEGRAGMASIVNLNRNIDIESFGRALKHNLPSYAVPVFLRMTDSLPKTGTFKLKKTQLRDEGYNVNQIKDTLYVFNTKYAKYVTLTQDVYNDILCGKLQL